MGTIEMPAQPPRGKIERGNKRVKPHQLPEDNSLFPLQKQTDIIGHIFGICCHIVDIILR